MCHRVLLTLFVLLLMVQPAMAHPGHSGHDFVTGWQHPFLGLDHLLAMVAVGLLAVRIGGRALWMIPAAFMISMILGGVAAAMGLPLPGAEWAIAFSVLTLGLLIAMTNTAPLGYATAAVGLFAFFHGHAHTAEMTSGGSMASYAAGFLTATALLHLCSVLGGLLLAKTIHVQAVRIAGAAISAAGALMVCGIL